MCTTHTDTTAGVDDEERWAVSWMYCGIAISAAAATYILSCDSGSYIETGIAADLLKGYKVSADGGSFALTGADVDLLKGSIIDIGSGSYVLTGIDATFGRTYILSVESGAYVLTGYAATLNYSGGVVARRKQGMLLGIYGG